MKVQKFDVGQTVTMSAVFTTPPPSSTPVDPTTVLVRVRNASGTTTYTPQHDGTGEFSYQYVITVASPHYFRFEGSGNLNSAEDSFFEVNDSPTLN